MKRLVRHIILWSAAAVLLVTAGAGAVYCRSLAGNIVCPGGAKWQSADKITPGTRLETSFQVLAPVAFTRATAVFTPGNGAAAVGEVKCRRSFGIKGNRFDLTAVCGAVASGKVSPGKIDLTLTSLFGEKRFSAAVTLPGFTVSPYDGKPDGLQQADALPLPEAWYRNPFLIAGTALSSLILTLLALWYFLRKRRRIQDLAVPPWERARGELGEISAALTSATLSPETAIARVSDVIRGFLEERFLLPFSKLTGDEFREELRRSDLPLPASCKPFLRDFLRIADLIKFAKAPARPEQAASAIASAGRLIDDCVPAPETAEGGKACLK